MFSYSCFLLAKACHEFALTIQECMTNEGAMEHYNLDQTKVRQDFIRCSSKKPLRGKQASSKTLWTDEEEQALVTFILFWQIKNKSKMVRDKPQSKRRSKGSSSKASDGKEDSLKIMTAKSKLWDDCAKFISRKACLPKRSGKCNDKCTLIYVCGFFFFF